MKIIIESRDIHKDLFSHRMVVTTDPIAVINVLDVIDLKMSIQIIHKYLK